MNQNPFLPTLSIPYVKVIKRDVPAYKTDLAAGDYYEVEKQGSTRLYREKDNYVNLLHMSASTLRIFLWIMYYLGPDATSIKLDEKQLCQMLECTERQLRRVKSELVAHAVIAKKEDNEYWVNPRYLAADSRMKLFPEQAVCVATIRERGRIMSNGMG